jgi:hypothetical protein
MPAGELDVLDVLRRRNSGNDAPGMAPRPALLSEDFLDYLLRLRQAWTARRSRVPGEDALTVSVAWLHGAGPAIGLYDDGARPLHVPPSPRGFVRTMQESLPSPEFRYNMSAFVLSFVITADITAALRSHSEATLRRLHLAAGAIAQDLSLAAAALGLFARPVRMFREDRLESGYALDGHVLYQVLCGFNRSTNVAMELL